MTEGEDSGTIGAMPYRDFQELFGQGRYQEAARYAEQETQREPGSAQFWLTQQAKALIRLSDYRSALEVGGRALALEPGNPFAVAVTADALLGLERLEEALPRFEELLRSPRLQEKGRKGTLECLGGLRRWSDALERLAAWGLPEGEALPWRVKALSGLGRYEESLECCRRWLELKPHHPPALWARTELEVRAQGLPATLETMGRLARIPSLPGIYQEIYASLSRKAGQPEEAMKAYERIGAEGEQARIQKQKAFTLAKSGREAEAIALLEELLKLEPKDRYLHASYAAACRRVGELERAINFYNQLLGRHPEERSLYGRIKGLQKKLAEGQRP
jgi:Flp pilus assembly protein TadD